METNRHTRLFSVLCYITWIGWIIAFVLRDKKDEITHQHINQGLALNIIGILISTGNRIGGFTQWLCGIIAIIALILTIWGIVRALMMSDKPLPIIGNFRLL